MVSAEKYIFENIKTPNLNIFKTPNLAFFGSTQNPEERPLQDSELEFFF